MCEGLDLFHASRDEWVALVLDLLERNADLERRLAWRAKELAELRRLVAGLTEKVGELLAEHEAGGDERGRDGGERSAARHARPPAARPRNGSAALTATGGGG